MSAQCRACGTDLLWAVSPNGKACPLRFAPTPDGNVLTLQPRGLTHPLAVVLSGDLLQEARDAGVPLRLNHFADCPERARFRKPEGAAA